MIVEPGDAGRLRARLARAPRRARAGRALHRRAAASTRAVGPVSPRCSGSSRRARARRRGGGRAVGAARRPRPIAFTAVKLVGRGLPRSRSGSGRCSEPTDDRIAGAARRARARERLRAGHRGQRPQPEDRALLPRVPAAVRRRRRPSMRGCRSPSSARSSSSSRLRQRSRLGAGRGDGRRRPAAQPPLPPHPALRLGNGLRRPRRRDGAGRSHR